MASGPRREDRPRGDHNKDQRDQFQRDRDRILYTAAFRRLAEVTQVVSPGEVGVFHNRLTHTLKVAQVARRIAEMFLNRSTWNRRVEAWGGISPDVVEAAALAHDLGHPPFGHIAENELNRLVSPLAGADGYEGNAQSFRIVTKLAARRIDSTHGLDLTRATLNATLKYPRLSAEGVHKYGAYRSEEAAPQRQTGFRSVLHLCLRSIRDSKLIPTPVGSTGRNADRPGWLDSGFHPPLPHVSLHTPWNRGDSLQD